MLSTQKQKGFAAVYLLFILLIVLSLCIGSLYIKYKNILKHESSKNEKNVIVDKYTALIGTDVLIDNITGMDPLDLPTSSDIRGFGTYKRHTYVFTDLTMIEYDPVKSQLVRIAAKNIPQIHSGTLQDGFAYLAINGDPQGQQPNLSFGTTHILVVDLSSNKITGVINALEKFKYKLLNPSIVSDSKYLWISSDDGVIKYNPLSDAYVFYPQSKLGVRMFSSEIHNFQGTIAVKSRVENKVVVYDSLSDSWKIEPKLEGVSENYGVTLANYISKSQPYNGDVYVLSRDGLLSIVKNNSFPQPVKMLNFPKTYDQINSNFYITDDLSHIVFFNINGLPSISMPQADPVLEVWTIDIETNKLTKLRISEGGANEDNLYVLSMVSFSNTGDNIINVIDEYEMSQRWGKPVFTIDLKKQTVTVLN